ncbi:hypothetical protein J4H86_21585 [Spiractinospora alimapuensis]|uniref:hypothetical protein n=1 Tax=Spiractinospora alimapuensis TaxID=2820884 RepID=UPI001F21F55A|nr:hypothetical protein [Spiractinospora alimapuensis]QVQ51374.1 hypothetical protein J4H86_21585 [Spiractinospora alimapuensis]
MRTPTRLGLYGGALVAVFAASFATAGAVVPDEVADDWTEETQDHDGDGHGGERSDDGAEHEAGSLGLTLEQDGYRLADVQAPREPDDDGTLSFTILDPEGAALTDFELSHEKELHLIVVRDDGEGFRHVHPERGDDGEWSVPWEWDAAGTYRVFADFVPAATGEDATLSSTVAVAGDFEPDEAAGEVTTTEVDDFEVALDGELVAGEPSTLTATVESDGEPVTSLEPYLGAYGHLVALREEDLGYLHVHPHGDDPEPDATSGPDVAFAATAPTPGRYLLYLDFQVDGEVHTARFVLDAR